MFDLSKKLPSKIISKLFLLFTFKLTFIDILIHCESPFNESMFLDVAYKE